MLTLEVFDIIAGFVAEMMDSRIYCFEYILKDDTKCVKIVTEQMILTDHVSVGDFEGINDSIYIYIYFRRKARKVVVGCVRHVI